MSRHAVFHLIVVVPKFDKHLPVSSLIINLAFGLVAGGLDNEALARLTRHVPQLPAIGDSRP